MVGSIGPGLLVLVGVGHEDSPDDASALAAKLARLRVFRDESGKMQRSVLDTGGGVLVVSQFTLYGDARRGNRPSFTDAAHPDAANALVERLIEELRRNGVTPEQGVFGAMMEVDLVNDGPVTLVLRTEAGRIT